jgi:hypothetical protein
MYILFDGLSPYLFESITVSGTAIGLTSNTAREVLITVEGDIRYRLDGTDPTTTEGHKAVSNEKIELRGRGQIDQFKAINITDDVQIRVTYFK